MSRLHPRVCFFFAFLIFVWPIPSYPTLGSTGCGSSSAGHRHHRRLPRVVGQRFITVDPRGRGDFISVQAAVESVPENNRMNVTILVTPGYYIEKVVIPPNKPYITLQGAGRNVSIIEWQDVAGDDNIRDIYKYQIQLPYATTASVSVFASYFTARNISFRNSAPASMSGGAEAQAAALRISGDKAYFSGCGFYGGRGTLHDDVGRHYFKECYIEGSIDFILGNGRSMYKDCELHSIATRFGSIAAQGRTSADERTGFAFVKCRVTGRGPLYVGRALAPYSRIVFSYTFFDDLVAPSGWDDWNPSNSTNKKSVFFGTYKCWGPGSEAASEGSWVRKLDYKKARPFLVKSFVNGRHWMGPGDA